VRVQSWVFLQMIRKARTMKRGVKVFPRSNAYREHYSNIFDRRAKLKAKKGVPKRDGSGHGRRDNEGRGGCEETQKTGKGKR
jgi:hypothetical protein